MIWVDWGDGSASSSLRGGEAGLGTGGLELEL